MTRLERADYRALSMFAKGAKMATELTDGKPHRVAVIRSSWDGYTWESLVVDERRVEGEKLGLGNQRILHEALVLAPLKGGANDGIE